MFTFRVEDTDGHPANDLELYMGMPGHAVFIRRDLRVFAHVHPSGSAPMAAIAIGQRSLDVQPAPNQTHAGHAGALPATVLFPMASPSGDYRIFVRSSDAARRHRRLRRTCRVRGTARRPSAENERKLAARGAVWCKLTNRPGNADTVDHDDSTCGRHDRGDRSHRRRCHRSARMRDRRAERSTDGSESVTLAVQARDRDTCCTSGVHPTRSTGGARARVSRGSDTPENMETISGFSTLADRARFIVAYPEGSRRTGPTAATRRRPRRWASTMWGSPGRSSRTSAGGTRSTRSGSTRQDRQTAASSRTVSDARRPTCSRQSPGHRHDREPSRADLPSFIRGVGRWHSGRRGSGRPVRRR